MPDNRLRLLYVCDFGSIHSRSLISYFAARPDRYAVTVVSSEPAEAMPGVSLLSPGAQAGRNARVRHGNLGRLIYGLSLSLPRFYMRLRAREIEKQARWQGERIWEMLADLRPDLIHGLRTQPEGLVAAEVKRAFPEAPFFLTTWGQDFVVWGRSGSGLRASTRAAMARVDHLVPDNPRDARLAVEEFGAAPRTTTVMPATGGLNLAGLAGLAPEAAYLPGEPSLLSMRGYENAYIRIRVLLQALRIFVETHPRARLYLDGPKGHPGYESVRSWVRRYGLEEYVELVHLDRPSLFRHMQGTDLYVSATRSDGLPISLLEALYFGQLPVTSRSESISPPIRDGENGVLVDDLTPSAIAEGWERACSLVGDRERRTEHNRALLRADYEREANLRRLEGLYRDALDHPRSGAGT